MQLIMYLISGIDLILTLYLLILPQISVIRMKIITCDQDEPLILMICEPNGPSDLRHCS